MKSSMCDMCRWDKYENERLFMRHVDYMSAYWKQWVRLWFTTYKKFPNNCDGCQKAIVGRVLALVNLLNKLDIEP